MCNKWLFFSGVFVNSIKCILDVFKWYIFDGIVCLKWFFVYFIVEFFIKYVWNILFNYFLCNFVKVFVCINREVFEYIYNVKYGEC